MGEGSAGLDGLLHVEDEGALFPLHLDELEGVLGDLLAVGDHEGAALLALEVGDRWEAAARCSARAR